MRLCEMNTFCKLEFVEERHDRNTKGSIIGFRTNRVFI